MHIGLRYKELKRNTQIPTIAATTGTGSEGRYRESEATLLEVVLFLLIIMPYHTTAKI